MLILPSFILLLFQSPDTLKQLENHFHVEDFQTLKNPDQTPLIPSYIVYDHDRLFAIESFDKQLVEFNKDGKVLRRLGGKGQGPGEFTRPRMVKTDKNGDVYVLDPPRQLFQIFRGDSHLKTVKINHLPQPTSFHVVEGKNQTLLYLVGSGQYKKTIPQGLLINLDGKVVSTIGNLDKHPLFPFWQGEVFNNQQLVMAHAVGNKFSVFDTQGNKVDDFLVAHPKLKIISHLLEDVTKEEVDGFKSAVDKEPHTQLFDIFISKNYFVTSWSRVNMETDRYRFYVVSDIKTKKTITALEIGLPLMGFKDDLFVFGDLNRDDVEHLEVYYCKPKFGVAETGASPNLRP